MRTIQQHLAGSIYLTAEQIMDKLGISRALAYRLLSEIPDSQKIMIQCKGAHNYIAAHRAAVVVYYHLRRRRGNPRFSDPEFQSEMARRRHKK